MPTARLAKGHLMPTKPVYWLIWMLDEKGVPHHSRLSNDKHLTPRGASMQAYGVPPSSRMLFWNCTSRVTDMRRMLRIIALEWQKAKGKAA